MPFGSKAIKVWIEAAARQAYPRGWMLHLPRLYSSDAQQQRIASAWLFIKYPPIIFLDVPTASLDAFKQGRAVVTISHSLAQIVDSACIYVIKRPQGRKRHAR